ncbi:hypothetical protein F4821DRAFT_279455 [Hypoxylon rubiginosum]|uniref:Uncharacterized protein n=1 Tax=Hypoxylon rubiginosum TaxID=110542 RepID=A0ACC0DI76_9PEZI|nr:hypothetical protein F4821DRAFT_279455 [Hypoxylon rubiginosum]
MRKGRADPFRDPDIVGDTEKSTLFSSTAACPEPQCRSGTALVSSHSPSGCGPGDLSASGNELILSVWCICSLSCTPILQAQVPVIPFTDGPTQSRIYGSDPAIQRSSDPATPCYQTRRATHHLGNFCRIAAKLQNNHRRRAEVVYQCRKKATERNFLLSYPFPLFFPAIDAYHPIALSPHHRGG